VSHQISGLRPRGARQVERATLAVATAVPGRCGHLVDTRNEPRTNRRSDRHTAADDKCPAPSQRERITQETQRSVHSRRHARLQCRRLGATGTLRTVGSSPPDGRQLQQGCDEARRAAPAAKTKRDIPRRPLQEGNSEGEARTVPKRRRLAATGLVRRVGV
jgi:hypothetical protein